MINFEITVGSCGTTPHETLCNITAGLAQWEEESTMDIGQAMPFTHLDKSDRSWQRGPPYQTLLFCFHLIIHHNPSNN